MPSRTERRKEATKRQIMGVLHDSTRSNIEAIRNVAPKHFSSSSPSASTSQLVSKDIDGTNQDHVRLLIDDLQQQLKQRQEVLTAEAQKGKQEQQQVHFSGMMKLAKSVKKMTVREFNESHKCDLLELLKLVRANPDHDVAAAPGKKRIRPGKELETPAPKARGKVAPPSTARTLKRGEALFSMNGSPVDAVEEGALVATVSKKRRGDAVSAVFDINVGEGRYINLADPSTLQHLEGSMKDSAISQILVLQDQMASLMAQLTKTEVER